MAEDTQRLPVDLMDKLQPNGKVLMKDYLSVCFWGVFWVDGMGHTAPLDKDGVLHSDHVLHMGCSCFPTYDTSGPQPLLLHNVLQ
jgi:hypothetical protein